MDIRKLIGNPVGDEVFYIRCPFHDDTGRPNMAVYKDGTKCFRCGAKETAEEFQARIKNGPKPKVSHAGSKKTVAPPFEPWMADIYHNILFGKRSDRIKWFVERGIHEETLRKQKIGHTGEKFVIPVWDGDSLVGVHYRIDPDFWPEPTYYDQGPPKYLNPKGQPVLVYKPGQHHRGPLVICEGPLDALLLSQMRWDARTTTTGANSLRRMFNRRTVGTRREVYIATDQDAAGEQAYLDLIGELPQARRVRWNAGKDVTDFLSSVDAGERSSAWLHVIRRAS